MGFDLNVHFNSDSNTHSDLLEKIKDRFKEFSMDIAFHPKFTLDENHDTGFCPIKLCVNKGESHHYDNVGKPVITGFELYFDDYNYTEELNEIRSDNSEFKEPSFFSKLFGFDNKTKPQTQQLYIENDLIDEKLSRCSKVLTLNFQSWDKSELRVSLYFSAILAELVDGVIFDPQNGRYLIGEMAIDTFPHEVKEYEDSIDPDEFYVKIFEKWEG